LVGQPEKAFEIRQAPPPEAAGQTPEAIGQTRRQVGKRTLLSGEADRFAIHNDVEWLRLWVVNHWGHCPASAVVAGNEVKQEIALGMNGECGGVRDDESG
jgi:hypothetical protein